MRTGRTFDQNPSVMLYLLGGWMLLASSANVSAAAATVRPIAQTAPMLGKGDVADDACVWVHPTDGSRSVIFGTNKSRDKTGGIYAFKLDGSRWRTAAQWEKETNWFAAGKRMNNVDLCQ